MDPLSSIMVRCSLLWMLSGFLFGGAMLVDQDIPGNWRLWMQPTHGHMLFVGWFLQFALGIAYWLLPRKRSPQRPLGYDLKTAQIAVLALNLGLLCRVAGEPWQRTGHNDAFASLILWTSAILQIAAAFIFAVQLWPRVAARAPRAQTVERTRS
ncbi:MAG: hypothetical protein M9947_04630 [Thermomicrobiales bacterium]|nr:hypothetical protein [Thermomicrobiales bacterium]